MRRGWTLSRKILCLALLNVALLGVGLLFLARAQFRFGPESLLLGPAHDRIRGIADAFTSELDGTPATAREQLVESYRKRYGADFYVATGRGQRVAGPELEFTPELLNEMRRVLPPPGRNGPPAMRPPPPPPQRGELEGDGPPPPPDWGRRIGGRGRGRGRPPLGALPDGRGSDWDRDGDGAEPPPAPRMPPESVFLWVAHNPTRYWAGARVRSASLSGFPGSTAILLIGSNSLWGSSLFFHWRLWLGVALTVIAVSVLCWAPFIRGLTHSIAHLDRVTQEIALGRFDVQAGGRRSDELGHLGEQIDRMALRLQSFVKNQKRFLGDIAHELCAPIARIQFALGILEQKAGEGQERHVAALHEEIQEMSALVNELLSFSKAGMQAGSAPLVGVSLGSIVERAVAREAFGGASVETRVEPGAIAMGNEALLLRALANVVRNAIRYAGDAGPIEITAAREGKRVSLRVADSGPGLPDAELEEVFAPFYRPEAARTRETGGAGLGLAIVRTCVEACGGTVSCRNRNPGLEVEIKLVPAAEETAH